MQPNLSHLYETTPVWLDTVFILTTAATAGLLYVAFHRVSATSAMRFLVVSLIWLATLVLLANYHVFQHLDAKPPGFVGIIGPPLLLLTGPFLTPKGRTRLRQLPLPLLTLLHTVRLPVELTLYGLYTHQQIPQLMTFEGRNLDILAGLTAPIMAYFVFQGSHVSTRWLLIWNGLALGLVINIVVQAILSAPFPFQQLAFEQPNVAVLKAPYVWLPGFIVPVVLFSHAVVIQRFLNERVNSKPSRSGPGARRL